MPQDPSSALALVGDGYTIEITLAAEGLKLQLLKGAGAITKVGTDDERVTAQGALVILAHFRNRLEDSRKEVKAPVLRIGEDIDQKAAQFGKEVSDEEKRIKRLLSEFAVKQETDRRAREAEARKIQEGADRQRREAEEAQRRADVEAEKRRWLAAEAARKAAAPDTSLADAAAALAAERKRKAEADARAETERLRIEAANDAAAAADRKAMEIAAAAPAPVKMMLDFTVTDIAKLYAAAPHLVELTPKRREILAALYAMKATGGHPVGLPGIVVKEVPKISTR